MFHVKQSYFRNYVPVSPRPSFPQTAARTRAVHRIGDRMIDAAHVVMRVQYIPAARFIGMNG
jgi:hypothetical protein